MQAARRREILTLTSRLGRRTEAGPRQVLARVRRRLIPDRASMACKRSRLFPDNSNVAATLLSSPVDNHSVGAS